MKILIAIFFTLLFSSELIAQCEEVTSEYVQIARWKRITRDFVWDEPEPAEILLTLAYHILIVHDEAESHYVMESNEESEWLQKWEAYDENGYFCTISFESIGEYSVVNITYPREFALRYYYKKRTPTSD